MTEHDQISNKMDALVQASSRADKQDTSFESTQDGTNTNLYPQPNLVLSEMQTEALEKIKQWYAVAKSSKEAWRYFNLHGFAGSGKSSLLGFLFNALNLSPNQIAFATFTGKASIVLSQKLLVTQARTVHSWIYAQHEWVNPQTGKKEVRWGLDPEKSDLRTKKLIVIDESSMIGKKMAKDLLSFGVPVLAFGDPGQLPPINEEAFFLTKPDFFLSEIHRQAQDSPIIKVATLARKMQPIPAGSYKDPSGQTKVAKLRQDQISPDTWTSADQVICSYNKTRVHLNHKLRQMIHGIEDARVLPKAGEKLICLYNNYSSYFFNGQICRVLTDSEDLDEETFSFKGVPWEQEDDENPIEFICYKHYFNPLLAPEPQWPQKTIHRMTLGYAITVHKAQGSQFNKVLYVDEDFGKTREEKAKSRYTAITRSADLLCILT